MHPATGLNVEAHYAKNIKSGLNKVADNRNIALIFVDINLYKSDRIHLIEELRQLSTCAPIIVISEIQSPTFEKLAFDAGASGFLCKTDNKDMLIDAVETACGGNIYKNHGCLHDEEKLLSDDIVITNRQYEILNLLSQGLLNKQIAGELSISINTVNAHLHDIFARLHVTNRTAAVQKRVFSLLQKSILILSATQNQFLLIKKSNTIF